MRSQKKQLVLALALAGLASHAPFAFAAEANSGQLDRVEVTGSNIKRSIKQEKALPVTILKTEDLAKQGLTTVEQVVNSIAANQSSQGASARLAPLPAAAPSPACAAWAINTLWCCWTAAAWPTRRSTALPPT